MNDGRKYYVYMNKGGWMPGEMLPGIVIGSVGAAVLAVALLVKRLRSPKVSVLSSSDASASEMGGI